MQQFIFAGHDREGYAMVIAVPYYGGDVDEHFGRAEALKVYTLFRRKVVGSQVVPVASCGEALAALRQHAVNLVFCGHLHEKLGDMLHRWGIEVYSGVQGGADDTIERFLYGGFRYDDNEVCTGGCQACLENITV